MEASDIFRDGGYVCKEIQRITKFCIITSIEQIPSLQCHGIEGAAEEESRKRMWISERRLLLLI